MFCTPHGMAASRGGGGGWTSGAIRALTVVDAMLLLATALHYAHDGAYWRQAQRDLRDASVVRAKWQEHLEDVRRVSARAVSRSAQLQMGRWEEAAARCPPVRPCPKVKPCRGVGSALTQARIQAAQAKARSQAQEAARASAALRGNAAAVNDASTSSSTSSSSSAGATSDASSDAVAASVPASRARVDGNDNRVDALALADGGKPKPGPAAPVFDPDGNDGVDFKVYVYDLPAQFHSELAKQQRRCIYDQYGTEIRIHEMLMRSPMRTANPAEAEFFFVPIYPECYLFRANQMYGKEGLSLTNKWYLEALRIVTHQHPWWNRTQGRDHFFVFAGARGPHIFKDWKKHIKKAIFMTPEGDRTLSEQFNTWKDIVIPGLEPEREFWSGALRNREPKEQKYVGYFRGTIHNKGGKSYSKGIRIKMEDRVRGDPEVVFTEASGQCNKACYRDEMRKSTFCLCPRGWSPWTLRAYQGMMAGCIPVILADEIEFPYENFMEWRNLTVKIPESRAEDTMDILRAIPQEVIDRKKAAIDEVWRRVSWPEKGHPDDAFHHVMRELGRKRRGFKASSLTFWT